MKHYRPVGEVVISLLKVILLVAVVRLLPMLIAMIEEWVRTGTPR